MTEIFILAKVTARSGYESEVAEAIRTLAASSQSQDGCLRYDLYYSRDVFGETLISETWADGVALSIHGQSEHIADFKNAIKEKADVEVQKLQAF